jgi:hypothetical protein
METLVRRCEMSVVNYVYVLLRVSDEGYDADYPIEAVFRNMEDAQQYRDDLVAQMREDEDISEDTDEDEVFEIVSRPLVNAIGEEV